MLRGGLAGPPSLRSVPGGTDRRTLWIKCEVGVTEIAEGGGGAPSADWNYSDVHFLTIHAARVPDSVQKMSGGVYRAVFLGSIFESVFDPFALSNPIEAGRCTELGLKLIFRN